MKRIRLSDLRANGTRRPPGYYDAVVAMGVIEGEQLTLSNEAYTELCQRFASPTDSLTLTVDATIAKTRYEICKTCNKSSESGFKCALHKGCCFGDWRAIPANKCPEGRW